MGRAAAVVVVALLLATNAVAQSNVDVVVIDLPYNAAHGLRAPSMQQSLSATASTYEASHLALQSAFGEKHPLLGRTAVATFDALTLLLPLPLTDVWLHEEFHRAVMGNRGVDSFNDVYRFQFAADSVAVSRVRDEDLAQLKAEHPADFVRLNSAGAEGETLLVQRLERQQFFRDSKAWHLPLYWLTKIGVYAYIASGSDASSDADTDEMNADDGADVERRDFTGHDFIAWMYDLSRPDEPYAARGIHPSGVGIDRYRKTSDLTPDERSFLDRQGRLALVNFLDPQLVGLRRFTTRGVEWNANAAHFLTSFGYTLDANLFVRTAEQKILVTLHHYVNEQRSFPGAEVTWLDRSLNVRGRDVRVSPRVALWMQPEEQRFRTSDARVGGLVGVRVDLAPRHGFGTYVEADAKSAGWVAGNEQLGASASLRFGVTRDLW